MVVDPGGERGFQEEGFRAAVRQGEKGGAKILKNDCAVRARRRYILSHLLSVVVKKRDGCQVPVAGNAKFERLHSRNHTGVSYIAEFYPKKGDARRGTRCVEANGLIPPCIDSLCCGRVAAERMPS